MTDISPEGESVDRSEVGPRWALWNYETQAWEVLPVGYDPLTLRSPGPPETGEERAARYGHVARQAAGLEASK